MDPRFNNPHLPQWTKLYKEITIQRVKKKRTLDTGVVLTQKRAFSKWTHIMKVDRSKPVTALAVAVNHYNKVITTKIIQAWYEAVRERGRLVRYRNHLFEIWKVWAPKSHKLRKFHNIATDWLRIQRVRKSFNFMSSICLKVIGKRTEKMKELRRNFCDRKVMICAYALLNKSEHVMMVDCWRRLLVYWKLRKNWKSFNIQMSYEWYRSKAQGKLYVAYLHPHICS
jgi:hypothetical protein